MTLLIGENIKKMRRDRNLTQEEMAAHLGISFQAVSKWERGDGLPDITLLPALSRYFGVTADELLGMEKINEEELLKRICQAYEENRIQGKHEENAALMREHLRQFPNHPLLLVQLSASLEHLAREAENEAERRAYLKESVAVQEQILRYGEDSEVRSATLYNICFSYWKLGEKEKAIEQAKKLSNLYKARENALIFFLEGEEKRQVAREAMEPLAWALEKHLAALADSDEDMQAAWEKLTPIFDLLYDGAEREELLRFQAKLNQ